MKRSVGYLIPVLATFALVLATMPVDAGCWECDVAWGFCLECDSSQSNTKNCVNKHPRCTGCIEKKDSNCESGGEGPSEEHRFVRFDITSGEWVMASQDTEKSVSELAETLSTPVCGPHPAYTIY